MEKHDIHNYLIAAQRRIEEAYGRIREHSSEDPGTAGDQGEEDWGKFLKEWLPRYFHVVNKGIIIFDSGYSSPQIDLLVLSPSYPPLLIDEKRYLAGGVVAAFECKTTLRAEHIAKAVKTSAEIRRHLPKRIGSPYKELNSTIIYGLLAHSHSWKDEGSTPLDNVEKALIQADLDYVTHPIECVDLITVADLATWTNCKGTYISPKLPSYNQALEKVYGQALEKVYGPNGSANTCYACSPIGNKVDASKSPWLKDQKDYFSPLSVLVSVLYSKLAWMFSDMRTLEEYFRKINMMGRGQGQMRLWDLNIYSERIRERVLNGQLSNGVPFDEWSVAFM